MAAGASESNEDLKQTPLHAQHVALGARMVPFAGYEMPVQYRDGIIAEHNWTREHAGRCWKGRTLAAFWKHWSQQISVGWPKIILVTRNS